LVELQGGTLRKLIYLVASTIDGFIAGEDRSDPTGTVFTDRADELAAEYPEMIPGHVRPLIGMDDVPNRNFDTVLEGRGSYSMGVDLGVADAYPHLRHIVFSTTLAGVADPAVELVSTDPVQKVRELKAEEGLDIWLCGGGSLAGSLRDEVDEIHLKLHPIVLGKGAPLFDSPDTAAGQLERYDLVSSRTFDSGVALLIYRRRH
jgi:dihydrofolate reductase